jgi:hypothetical protein
MKNEKNYIDPDNTNTRSNLINNSSSIYTYYYDEELKAIQRSIALLRKDIRIIVREEVEGAFQRN